MNYLFLAACLFASAFPARAAWSVTNTERGLEVSREGQPIARLVHGPAELKPFLHVFGPGGEWLTEWKSDQPFPHHRGIFIGWNRIRSDLGTSDLWHLSRNQKMLLRGFNSSTTPDSATLRARIEWLASTNENALLIREERSFTFTRPNDDITIIDARFKLTAARDLSLDGDLQHSGVHFRAAHQVAARESETKYWWEPDLPGPGGKVQSDQLKWARLLFPIGEKRFAVTHLNAPWNPVAELSWRAYGRFGFFFKQSLEKDESLELTYRFVVEPAASDDPAVHRRTAAEEYGRFVRATRYETRRRHDPNGIGKFYLGREIAHVMGHQAADWLERPEREREEQPDKMVDLLGLKPGDHVADIGAGTGYISRRMAQKVGPSGKVYAIEIQQEMLDRLGREMKQRGIQNVVPVLGTVNDPGLPENSIDLAIMVDVYHELEEPAEMLENILRTLKPGGRIAFVEYRAEDPNVPIKAVHKMSEAQVKREAAAAGLKWEKTIPDLPWQHLILVRKPESPAGSAR